MLKGKNQSWLLTFYELSWKKPTILASLTGIYWEDFFRSIIQIFHSSFEKIIPNDPECCRLIPRQYDIIKISENRSKPHTIAGLTKCLKRIIVYSQEL